MRISPVSFLKKKGEGSRSHGRRKAFDGLRDYQRVS